MANRPAPANSGMLKPRTKVTPSPNPKQPMVSKVRSASAQMKNAQMSRATSSTSGSKPITYEQARAKLKKMMRSGM
jgi:hypothetical protein